MITKVDSVEYDICETQRRIYEYMAEQGYDMKVFSEAFMTSDFCKRAFDTVYSRFQTECPTECADFYMSEFGNKLVKTNKPTYSVSAGYVGFMYRMLYIETSISSGQLAREIPYDEMFRLCGNFDHYGYEYIFKDIMKLYSFPTKNYISGFTPFSKEEYKALERKALEEQQKLEDRYIKNKGT